MGELSKMQFTGKIKKFHPQNFHMTVEDVETGHVHYLTVPISIFHNIKKYEEGTVVDVDTHDDVVKSVVKKGPVDG